MQINLGVEALSKAFTDLELHNHISGEELFLFNKVAIAQVMSNLIVFVLSEDIYKWKTFKACAQGLARIFIDNKKVRENRILAIDNFGETSNTALSVEFLQDTVRQLSV